MLPDDVKALAGPVLAHRLHAHPRGPAAGHLTPATIVAEVLAQRARARRRRTVSPDAHPARVGRPRPRRGARSLIGGRVFGIVELYVARRRRSPPSSSSSLHHGAGARGSASRSRASVAPAAGARRQRQPGRAPRPRTWRDRRTPGAPPARPRVGHPGRPPASSRPLAPGERARAAYRLPTDRRASSASARSRSRSPTRSASRAVTTAAAPPSELTVYPHVDDDRARCRRRTGNDPLARRRAPQRARPPRRGLLRAAPLRRRRRPPPGALAVDGPPRRADGAPGRAALAGPRHRAARRAPGARTPPSRSSSSISAAASIVTAALRGRSDLVRLRHHRRHRLGLRRRPRPRRGDHGVPRDRVAERPPRRCRAVIESLARTAGGGGALVVVVADGRRPRTTGRLRAAPSPVLVRDHRRRSVTARRASRTMGSPRRLDDTSSSSAQDTTFRRAVGASR